MRKFFALFMVVALLAVAGSAFASDVGGHFVPEDPSEGSSGAEITITKGSETLQTVTIDAAQIKDLDESDVMAAVEKQIESQLASAGVSLTDEEMAQVLKDIKAAVMSWFNKLQKAAVASLNGVLAAAETGIQDNSKLEVTPSSKTAAQEADAASAYLQMENYKLSVVTVLPLMKTKTAGIYSFMLPVFDSKLYGLSIEAFCKVDETGVEKGKTVMLNSKGDVVEKVPGTGVADVVPGFVSLAIYMEADKNYKPVVAVSTTEAQSKGLAASKEVTVDVSVATASTATFSTFVSPSLTKGTNYVTIPADAVSKTGWTYTDAEETKLEGTDDYEMLAIASFPAITAPTTTVNYIAAVSFDNGEKTADDLYINAASFYPDNVLQAESPAKYFKEGSDGKLQELTASEILAGGKFAGYVAFQLTPAKGATKPVVTVNVKKGDTPTPPPTTVFTITASPRTVTFASPAAEAQTVTLSSNSTSGTVTYTATVSPTTGLTATVSGSTLTLKPSATGTYVVTVTGNNGTDTATTTVNVTVNKAGGNNPGSSSGGCSAGFSALALAALGAFIAIRRK